MQREQFGSRQGGTAVLGPRQYSSKQWPQAAASTSAAKVASRLSIVRRPSSVACYLPHLTFQLFQHIASTYPPTTMSGYRTIHRENRADQPPAAVGSGKKRPPPPLWSVKFSPCRQSCQPAAAESSTNPPSPQRLLASGADGIIRAYRLTDKLASATSPLDATAVKVCHTDSLAGTGQAEGGLSLGYSALDVVRNYAGSDRSAGGEVVVAINPVGCFQVWTRAEQPATVDGEENGETGQPQEAAKTIKAKIVFTVQGATGTTLAIRPVGLGPVHGSHPKAKQRPAIVAAVGCLDGSVQIVSTGVGLHPGERDAAGGNEDKDPVEAGTVHDKLGTGSAVPTSFVWSKSSDTLAVGRKDGTVDLYKCYSDDYSDGGYRRIHRLLCHPKPVRGLTFTSDDALLISGDDEGTLAVHDVVRPSNTAVGLVGAVLHAHSSLVLDLAPLPDGKRFASVGADGLVHVWDVGMLNSGAVHSFAEGKGTGIVWGVSTTPDGRRIASVHDNGMLVLYSAEE